MSSRKLRLTAFTDKFIALTENEQYRNASLSYRELVVALLTHMAETRASRRLQKHIDELGLEYPEADLGQFVSKGRIGIDRNRLVELLTCEWIRERRHLAITGMAGTGKTWLCDCLAIAGVIADLSVSKFRCSQLLRKLNEISSAEFADFKRSVLKHDVIYLDAFGIGHMTEDGCAYFAELVQELNQAHLSIMINSQLARADWKSLFPREPEADYCLSRILKPTTLRYELECSAGFYDAVPQARGNDSTSKRSDLGTDGTSGTNATNGINGTDGTRTTKSSLNVTAKNAMNKPKIENNHSHGNGTNGTGTIDQSSVGTNGTGTASTMDESALNCGSGY